jgi:calcineurin-like phosphoesterase family protein
MKQITQENNKVISFSTTEQEIWFTSDTHFYHGNIIEYTGRPFHDVWEMNESLISNWNERVRNEDIIFHLGDFAHCGSEKLKDLLERLKGRKYLILGNHDWRTFKTGHSQRFEGIYQQMCIKIDGRRVYLNHFPFLCFTGTFKSFEESTFQLFGHVHSGPRNVKALDNPRLINLFPTQYDVGVDNNEFAPVSWKEVNKIITSQYEESIRAHS